jgi:uncharacterized protein (TIGR03085 family)
MSASSLADRERATLADLLDKLGPDAPTCCEGWTTAHLAAHLAVRDRRPDAMAGFALEGVSAARALTARSHAMEDRLRTRTPYAEVVDRVRSGPPRWMPTAWPGVAGVVNSAEFAIHHEDVRRAQPDWKVRDLPRDDQDTLWTAVGLAARRSRGGLVLRRSDVPGTEKRIGAAGRTVEGEPLELLLWASGRRDVARVTVTP